VVIHGKGAHGGMPHLSIDPVAIAASSILTIQTIISRETDPLESAVISICKLNAGGDAYNVIPDSVMFGGTIRYHNTKLAKYLPDRISEILGGIVPAMRGSYKFELFRKFPATINDEAMTTLASNVAEEAFGKENVFRMNPRMGSEDFSYYLQKIPGTFVFLGARNEEKGIVYPQHHPMFDVDEDALPSGAAMYSAVALEYLARRD
jgi:amidohydrolase